MCSIQGIAASSPELIAQMNRCTAYRGPDDAGIFSDKRIALGHNRLSILDLSPRGHQPMANAAKTLHITFNGEIYNFKELRAGLVQAGERFISETDTEVLLRGYEREGAAFFKKLRGMWAFAIYDAPAGKVVLSRDPFGIKPLYYYLREGFFAFSSELRGLRPVLSRYGSTDDALAHRLYFVYGYIPAPHSPFLEVRKMLPGEILSFDLTTRVIVLVETILPYEDEAPTRTLEEALDDTVQAHFVSDVPVGLWYSGGIDSTLLLAKAYQLGFSPEPFFLRIPSRLDNEYALAAAQKLGVKLTTFEFGETQALQALERARMTLDEPFADSSYIPTEYLSSQVSKTHKVVLSGEGGDEFFGGYHRHNHLLGLTAGTRLVPGALVAMLPTRLRRAVESKINHDPFAAYVEFVRVDEGLVSRREAVAFLKRRIATTAVHDELGLALDQTLYLPDDLLFKIDRAGMRHGLEGRVPFLDKRFFAVVRGIHAQERHGGGTTGKALLKDLLRKYLPERLVERPKQGFSMPLSLLKKLPGEVVEGAIAEAERHPELVPFDPRQAHKHPHLLYALIMWAGWRESFKQK